jgi:hypothetical protein
MLRAIEFLVPRRRATGVRGPGEDTDGGLFGTVGGSGPNFDEVLGAAAAEGMAATHAYLFGRKAYESESQAQRL